MVVARNDEDDSTILISLLVIVSDDKGLCDLGEFRAIIDDLDESASQRVYGLVYSKIAPSETGAMNQCMSAESVQELILLSEKVAIDAFSDELSTFCSGDEAQPGHIVICVDDRGQMLVRVDDASLLVDCVLLDKSWVALESANLLKAG